MDENLTLDEQACNFHTMRHIEYVRNLINRVVAELLERGQRHDQSKLAPPEVAAFTEVTPKLAACTYGSPEYDGYRKQLGDALAHHYAKNRHHPEHFPEVDDAETRLIESVMGWAQSCDAPPRIMVWLAKQLAVAKSSVGSMSLLDVLEMALDWRAAAARHNDGNLRKSIEKNADRFGMAPQLVHIFENTADFLE